MTEQQTSNLPAVTETRALVAAPADTDSWTSVVGEVAKLAQYVADTEFVPKKLRGNAPAAAAAILYGREIGLPPMTALNGVHIIEGAPSLAAEQMRSLVLAAGHDLEFIETTGTICRVRGRRRGSETWTPVEWTIDMARAAGLLHKDNWKNYPRRMLQARASSELCELVFPDVIHGFRAVEAQLDAPDEQENGDAAAAPRATTRVRRTRAAGKPAETLSAAPDPDSAKPAPPAGRPAAPSIPLPGEDGYDSPQGPGTPPGSAAHGSDVPGPPETSEDGESRATDPSSDPGGDDETSVPVALDAGADPAPVDEPVDEPSDVVDAEIVGETPPVAIAGIRPAQRRMILSKFGGLGVTDREERLRLTGILAGRPVESTNELSKDEAGTVIDALALCNSLEQLVRVCADTEAAESGDDPA